MKLFGSLKGLLLQERGLEVENMKFGIKFKRERPRMIVYYTCFIKNVFLFVGLTTLGTLVNLKLVKVADSDYDTKKINQSDASIHCN